MQHFDRLTPELMLTAIEAQGFHPTGALFPLNSYENRVYAIELDEADPIIAKFYRPERWSVHTIAEEHTFVWAAENLEIPIVTPVRLPNPMPEAPGLGCEGEFFYAIYPKFRGRAEAEHTTETLTQLGRTLGRLHNLGADFTCRHRMTLSPTTYGHDSIAPILALPCVPREQLAALTALLPQAVQLTENYWGHASTQFAIHGDCHHGNILWNAHGPHLLDFDDMVVAPPVQDIWMLFSGPAEDQVRQREAFFEGYSTFRPFNESTLILAEPLRTLRLIRHAAWLGARHEEPAFQTAFPYFVQPRYWEEFTQTLREQIGILQELQWA
jgi:Ser/Thr protein kinase RdoA (MazF antagonist)